MKQDLNLTRMNSTPTGIYIFFVLYFLLYEPILNLSFMNYGKRDKFIMNES
jgi:hypothetical protein